MEKTLATYAMVMRDADSTSTESRVAHASGDLRETALPARLNRYTPNRQPIHQPNRQPNRQLRLRIIRPRNRKSPNQTSTRPTMTNRKSQSMGIKKTKMTKESKFRRNLTKHHKSLI